MRTVRNIKRLAPVMSHLGAFALIIGVLLASAQPALAGEYVARITARIPGAPATAWVVVEWLDPADGQWKAVPDWQGAVDYTTSGVPYKQWKIYSDDYGKGPYRWVVYVEEDGAVWATSTSFYLPRYNGINIQRTLAGTTAVLVSAPHRVATPPTLTATTENVGFETGGDVFSRITLIVDRTGPNGFVGVQYLDANGVWQDVAGWQTAVSINAIGLAVVRWGVEQASFGQGPLRWVVYSEPGGAIIGYSPTFALPTDPGIDFVMHLWT